MNASSSAADVETALRQLMAAAASGAAALRAASATSAALGAASLALNVFVVATLARHRRRVMRNVFYVLVLHCALVDCVRGACLIVWCLPYFDFDQSLARKLLVLKMNGVALVFLRTCNLLTIFNVLVFTVNEFIVIKHPLRYRQLFRRRVVLSALAISWLVGGALGVGAAFVRTLRRFNVLVLRNDSQMNGSVIERQIVVKAAEETTRLHTAFRAGTIALCVGCLVTVVVCYGMILDAIRCYHRAETADADAEAEAGKSRRLLRRRRPPPRCRSHRKWSVHLMSRHKYLVVIATVITVDILFLVPYLAIQVVSLLYLNRGESDSLGGTMSVRLSLQLLIGVHAVCQPACYFRMAEFRRLACCRTVTRRPRSTWQRSLHTWRDEMPTAAAAVGGDHLSRASPVVSALLPADESAEVLEQTVPIVSVEAAATAVDCSLLLGLTLRRYRSASVIAHTDSFELQRRRIDSDAEAAAECSQRRRSYWPPSRAAHFPRGMFDVRRSVGFDEAVSQC